MASLENATRFQASAATPETSRPRSRSFLLRPAIIYLIIMTQIPVLFTLAYSVTNWNLLRPDKTRFVGLDNYLYFLQDSDTGTILLNTLTFVSCVIVFSLVFGMALALLLNRQFRGRGIARTLMITPMLIMPTVSAVMWKNMMLNPNFGLIPELLAALGLPRVDLLNAYPLFALILVVTWEWTPFMMLILLAGLQSVEQEWIEAAQLDGASPISMFTSLILPHLSRYIEIAVLLETLFVLNIFGEIFITTTGGPGLATTTLTFNIFLEAFSRWNIGRASAYGVFAVILANIVTLFYIRIIRGNKENKAAA